MRLRLAILGTLAMIAALAVFAVLGVERAVSPDGVPGASLSGGAGTVVDVPTMDRLDPLHVDPDMVGGLTADGRTLWARDNWFLVLQNAVRWPNMPRLDDIQAGRRAGDRAPGDPIRVVVVGDSHPYGYGNADASVRWPTLLEEELNRRTGPGTFEVVVLAQPGTSTLSHEEWLRENPDIVGSADVIVDALVANDVVPSGLEKVLCPTGKDCEPTTAEYTALMRECIRGNQVGGNIANLVSGLAPELAKRLIEGECTPQAASEATGLPTNDELQANIRSSRYWPMFQQAISSMLQTAHGRPLLVTPMRVHEDRQWPDTATDFAQEFAAQGAVVVPEPTVEKVLAGPWDPDMEVNPGDGHPGPMVTTAYAKDTATAILQAVSPEAVRVATAAYASWDATHDHASKLVTSWLPQEMLVEQTQSGRALVSYAHGERLPAYSTFRIGGRQMPAQFVPCGWLGRPHVRLMLDRSLPAQTPVTIALTSKSPLEVFGTGYDAAGRIVVTSQGTVSPGKPLTVHTGDHGLTGLLLADPQQSGCPLDAELDMPAFSLTLETPGS